jgi:hypothetical protein
MNTYTTITTPIKKERKKEIIKDKIHKYYNYTMV